jgi:hypothetical protein
MKVTILNGALAGDQLADRVHDHLATALAAHGWHVQAWTLRDETIAYCLGCFQCWTKTPGLCRIDDTGRAVAASVINSNVTIYLTPITFGGYASPLKKAVDRMICLVSPLFTRIDGEVHHRPRYGRYPILVGLGLLPEPDPEQERIFATLLSRNAINLQAPAHASYVIHGNQVPAELPEVVGQLLAAGEYTNPARAPLSSH